MEATLAIERPERWDNAFDPEFREEDLDRILAVPPFCHMDPANFPRRQPLREILRNDTRIHRPARGEIIVRAGDYGTSAFMVVRGAARVVVSPPLPPGRIGRREHHRRSLWRVVAQLWSNHRDQEVRTPAELGTLETPAAGDARRGIILQDVPRVLDQHRTTVLGPGEFFGEIAALSRMPRTATIFAETEDTRLLEIRWQGLRDLLKYDPALRAHIDQIYRANALANALQAIPLFAHLNEQQLARVRQETQFGTFGDYDWSGDYKRLARSGQVAPERETAVAQEGEYLNGVYLIRSGFARVTRRFGSGERTLDYLGAGRFFGLRELVHNRRNPKSPVPYRASLRVIGYAHTLFLPARMLEEVVLPGLPEHLLPAPFTPEELQADDNDPLMEQGGVGARLGPELMEFLGEHRFFNGTATMVIDLERCTRCDDCVRACASTHDNNPRFLRHGPTDGRIMVAQACLHCSDPVCMLGCPTGAIHRDEAGGNVVINQSTCIGCTSCATNCPYEAIRMVNVHDADGHEVVDQESRPVLKATKCDLCVDQFGGPACQRACPHDALLRVNLNRLDTFARWFLRR